MPVRAYKLAPPLHSCCFEMIHSSAKQLCEERSLFSQTSTHWVSLSNSVIISCQHRQISPPNSNNVSAQRSIKSFTCAMDSLPNRMRYSSSVISQLSFRNCCSCMAHALSRYAAVDLFNQGKWEDLWKLANKAGERAKARAAKNPRPSKPKFDAKKDAYSQKCARAGKLSKAAATLYKISPPACNAETVDRLRLLHPE